MHKQSNKQFSNQVYSTPLLLIVGVVGMLFFGILLTVFLVLDIMEPVSMCVFLLFFLLSAGMILAFFNCRIFYNDSAFRKTNLLRMGKTYLFTEITGFTKGKGLTVHMGSKKIRIDELSVGLEDFSKTARKAFRKANNGTTVYLPEIPHKLFRDHIENPEEFLIVYAIVFALLLFALFLFRSTADAPSYRDLHEISLEVSSYAYSETGDILMYTENGEAYTICYMREVLAELDPLLNALEAQTPLRVRISNDPQGVQSGELTGAIMELETDSGDLLLSYQDAAPVWEAHSRQTAKELSCFVYGLMLLWAVYVAVSCYVMTHADRYPRLVRLFVKQNYLRTEHAKTQSVTGNTKYKKQK